MLPNYIHLTLILLYIEPNSETVGTEPSRFPVPTHGSNFRSPREARMGPCTSKNDRRVESIQEGGQAQPNAYTKPPKMAHLYDGSVSRLLLSRG
jgi:hypothetical protein